MPIGSIIPEIMHPFGKGILSSTGVTYGALVSTAGSTSFITVEEQTVTLPNNAAIKEMEFGLTAEFLSNVSTNDIGYKWEIKDDAQTSYDTLVGSTTINAATSSLTVQDFTWSGRIVVSTGTYFTGNSPTFQVRLSAMSSASTGKAAAAAKNTSYLLLNYRLFA